MTKHEMRLQSKYFDFIKYGTKRIELRLFDEKRSSIRLGDRITFYSTATNDSIDASVIGLLRYASFEELFADFSIEMLADSSMSKEALLKSLGEFYSIADQAKLGVLGIRIACPAQSGILYNLILQPYHNMRGVGMA